MSIQQERKITVLTEGGDEGDPKSKDDPFWGHLPGERRMLGIKVGDIKVQSAEKGGKDDDVKAFEPVRLAAHARSPPSTTARVRSPAPRSRAPRAAAAARRCCSE